MKKILATIAIMLPLAALSCNTASQADATSVKAEEIMKKIKAGNDVLIKEKHIKGILDLSAAGTGAKALPMSAAYIGQELTFINCVFDDDVTAFSSQHDGRQNIYTVFSKNVTFYNCTFTKKLNLQQATFNSHLAIDDCHVIGETNLCALTTSGTGASFTGNTFDSDVLLISANIAGRTSFAKSKFQLQLNLQYTHFNDAATFTDVRFGTYTDMSNPHFGSDAYFTNSSFGGRVVILNATFLSSLQMPKCKFADNISISGSTFLSSVNLTNAMFSAQTTIADNYFTFTPTTTDLQHGTKFDLIEHGNKTANTTSIKL